MLEPSYEKNTMQYNMCNFIIFLLKIALNKGILSYVLCRLKWDG